MNLEEPLIIAIDGGAGTGTSTAAEGVAKALGIPHLNTGSMYRAIAWECMRQDTDFDDAAACGAVANTSHIELEKGTVAKINGHDVTKELYTAEVSRNVPRIAAHLPVREAMIKLQREIASEYGGVLEGRDIGGNVFPDTPHKFFFTCDPEERVRRVNAGGRNHETRESLLARDEIDANREHNAFQRHESAIEIDTTDMTPPQVVQTIVDAVKAKQ